MINKKNLLGKEPHNLGDKDAIHTAIVAVRAACPIEPGQRCGLNEHREAVLKKDGPGVADPFRRGTIITGTPFWLLLCQDEIPNVRHEWDHPTIDFRAPDREPVFNKVLKEYADAFGITFDGLMQAAKTVVSTRRPATYTGPRSGSELDVLQNRTNFDNYDFWDAFSEEAKHEFPNYGSECCPEYQYPECKLFEVK